MRRIATTIAQPVSDTGVAIAHGRAPEAAELRARNAAYDSATGPLWQLGVYEPVHDGWRFTNIGGRTVLTFIGRIAKLRATSCAVEIGSGLGDTSRFLSREFGCRVIGVDMNATQVRHAREMARTNKMTDRLVFVEGNIEDDRVIAELREQIGASSVDLVYTMDVLMLTADPATIINRAAKLAAPHGWVALAEVTSGPAMTEARRKQLWEEDDMRSLLPPSDFAGFMRGAGLDDVRIVDRTPLAVDCFARMGAAFADRKRALIAAAGPAAYESWRNMIDVYLRCFRSGELLYTQLLAR